MNGIEELEVGTTVKIVKRNTLKYSGNIIWHDDMDKHIGYVGKIISVDRNVHGGYMRYVVEGLEDGGEYWIWTHDWVEEVKDDNTADDAYDKAMKVL